MDIGTLRKVNAIICSVAILFFMAHGIMGTIMAVNPFEAEFAFLAWAGVFMLLIHMSLAIYITMNKTRDPNPPTKGKHALQWITGMAVFCLVMFHIGIAGDTGSGTSFIAEPNMLSLAIMIGLMIALIAHVIINLKDMFIDMGMGAPEKAESVKRHSLYMGILVCVVFAVLAAALIWVLV